MHGKPQAANRGAGRTANKDQVRTAQAAHDGSDEGQYRVQKMIKEIIETTRCSYSQAELALLDASNNVEEAVNNILENANLDTWSHYSRKGVKKEEHEEPTKKEGKRQGRRNNQREGQRDGQPKGARNAENGNTEGRENRLPREKEDGTRRSQPRARREQGGKREGKKNVQNEHKEDGDEHWKNGPLEFNRRENLEERDQQVTESSAKPASSAAGTLSYADKVRKQKPKPVPVVKESPFKLQSDNKQAADSDGLPSDENVGFLTSTSKSPRQAVHHLDVESGGFHEDNFGAQPSSQKLQESLTAQLKNDLGLGKASAFSASPPKNYHEPLHQTKSSTVKAGVVEFLSGEAVSSGEWQFGFVEAAPAPQNTVQEENQFRRETPAKPVEPVRSDVGLQSSNLNEPNSSRGNVSTVLNQYVQNQQQQQQQFNRNRNGVNNLPFSNNYSDNNFNSPDLRYGAPSSPPKTQPVQQMQSQQTHHHQQHIFPPTQLSYGSYPYMGMYSPVAPGIREDFGILPFHQYNLNQMGMDLLMGGPQLANATSAGPLPTSHQGGHHQNSHQQQSVQQGLHNQNTHSQNQQSLQRSDHFNENNMFKQMSVPPSSQNNNGANGHNQPNPNLGNNQRQPQLLDNNSQGSVATAPPPGFGFISQRNMYSVNPSFPGGVAFNQFPYVMPKSK